MGLADPPSCPTDPVPAPQPASQSSCPPFPTTATSGQPLPVRGQRARQNAPSHEPWPVGGTACAGQDGVLLQNSTGPASSASPGMDPELNSPGWLGKHWDPMSSSTGPGRETGLGPPWVLARPALSHVDPVLAARCHPDFAINKSTCSERPRPLSPAVTLLCFAWVTSPTPGTITPLGPASQNWP